MIRKARWNVRRRDSLRLAQEKGPFPYLRMTAALSDGQQLYAVRYATDDAAPSLYYRWSESRGGMAVVSEPLEDDEGDWNAVPAASFCTFAEGRLHVESFEPVAKAQSLVQSAGTAQAALITQGNGTVQVGSGANGGTDSAGKGIFGRLCNRLTTAESRRRSEKGSHMAALSCIRGGLRPKKMSRNRRWRKHSDS